MRNVSTSRYSGNLMHHWISCVGICAVGLCTLAEDLDLTADVTIDVAVGETRTIDVLGGGAYTLTKTGAGTLRFNLITNTHARIVVEAGTLGTALLPLPTCAQEAWFHVDASKADSLVTTVQNGTNFVTQWNDTRAADGIHTRCATVSQTDYIDSHFSNRTYYKAPRQVRAPHLGSTNGRAYMDFGPYYTELDYFGAISADLGAAFIWSANCTQIRAVFMAFADHPSVYTIANSRSRGQFLLGDARSGTYHFHRGVPNSDHICALFEANASACITHGTIILNETACTGKALAIYPPQGFNVIEFETTGNVTAGAFGQDRTSRFGGIRIAECLVFTAPITSESDRRALRRYLAAKWQQAKVASLTLCAGTTLDLAGSGLRAGTLDVTGNATLAAGALSADVVSPGCSNLTVSAGTLELGDGAATGNVAFPADAVIHNDEGATTHIRTISGTGTLTKQGAGTLTVNALSDGLSSLAVQEGTLRLAPNEQSGAWLHVDASQTNTMTFAAANGTNFVTRWTDKETGRYAQTSSGHIQTGIYTNTTGSNVAYVRPHDHYPYLQAHYLNGRPVLDFGSYLSQNVNGGNLQYLGWGAALQWNEACSNVREFFVFAGDTEDVAQQAGGNGRAQFILSDVANSKFDFHRGYNLALFERRNDSNCFSSNICDGVLHLDGQVVKYSAVLPAGLHLLEGQTAYGPVRASSFAWDRNCRYGGQRLAEVLVFTNKLEELHRARLRTHLLYKWHGSNDVATAYDTVSVAPGAYLALPDAHLTATALTLGGTLEADRVTPQALAIQGAAATVVGTLDLGTTGGTITIDLPKGTPSGTYPLVTATALTGSLANWRAAAPALTNHLTLKASATGIDVTVDPKGLMIILK